MNDYQNMFVKLLPIVLLLGGVGEILLIAIHGGGLTGVLVAATFNAIHVGYKMARQPMSPRLFGEIIFVAASGVFVIVNSTWAPLPLGTPLLAVVVGVNLIIYGIMGLFSTRRDELKENR